MVRIVFVNPPIREDDVARHIPYGIAQLSAIADRWGAQVGVEDVNLTRFPLEVVRKDLATEIPSYGAWDIIAFSGLITTYGWQKEAMKALRMDHPASLFIAGGGCASSLHEDFLRWVPELDALCLPLDEEVLSNPSVTTMGQMPIGSKALSHDGTMQDVIKLYSRTYSGKLVELTPYYGFPARMTPNHPVLIVRTKPCRYTKKNGHPQRLACLSNCSKSYAHGGRSRDCRELPLSEYHEEWVPAGKLRVGDLAVYPFDNTVQDVDVYDATLPERRRLLDAYDKALELAKQGERSLRSIAREIGVQHGTLRAWLGRRPGRGAPKYTRCVLSVDTELLYLIGLYGAEGSPGRSVSHISLCDDEGEIADRVERAAKHLFNCSVRRDYVKEKHSLRLTLMSAEARLFFIEICGKGAKTKRLANWVMRLPPSKQSFVLKGLTDGDNYRHEHGDRFSVTSAMLAHQTRVMYFRSGKVASLHKRRKEAGFGGGILYEVNTPAHATSHALIHENRLLSPIRVIREIEYNGEVRNFDVKENHSYSLLTNLCVHNCYGEGEKTVLELLELANIHKLHDPDELAKVNGIIYREDLKKLKSKHTPKPNRQKRLWNEILRERRQGGSTLVRTEPRPLMTEGELNQLPYPAWDMFNLYPAFEGGYTVPGYFQHSPLRLSAEAMMARQRLDLITERGCPGHCGFCSHNKMGGDDLSEFDKKIYTEVGMCTAGRLIPLVRWQSAEYVTKMITHMLLRYKVDFIAFMDETFLFNKKRTNDLIDLWERNDLMGTFKWGCLGRAEDPDADLYRRMKDAGCTYISHGYESSDERMLKWLDKNNTVEQQQKTLDAVLASGITPHTTYIIGYPDEDCLSLYNTLKFWIKNGISCTPFFLTPYPYTRVFWECKDKILKQYDGDIEKFVLRCGDATDFIVNLTDRFTDAELLGARELMRNQDLPRFLEFCRQKGEPIVDPDMPAAPDTDNPPRETSLGAPRP